MQLFVLFARVHSQPVCFLMLWYFLCQMVYVNTVLEKKELFPICVIYPEKNYIWKHALPVELF